eukprot:375778-Rhodomonas_salina.1
MHSFVCPMLTSRMTYGMAYGMAYGDMSTGECVPAAFATRPARPATGLALYHLVAPYASSVPVMRRSTIPYVSTSRRVGGSGHVVPQARP